MDEHVQVSTEYSGYKREAEVKMHELQEERDQAREELQLAMVAGSVSTDRQNGAKLDIRAVCMHEECSSGPLHTSSAATCCFLPRTAAGHFHGEM